ncbi:beta strand repeat-containing protein [Filimonas lacunae]|nr:T9SS type A sorting domain-containing protein [Filimonas lacunae]
MPMPRLLLLLAFLLIGVTTTLNAQINTWTGSINGDWNTAGNWTGGVPDANDTVYIDPGPNYPSVSTANAVAKSITVWENALFVITANGSLTINGSVGFGLRNRGVTQNFGTLIIAATGYEGVYNEASFTNKAGGKIFVDQSGNNSGITNFTKGGFTNAGTITIGATVTTGQFGFSNFGNVSNQAGGQINIERTTEAALSNITGTFSNEGGITIGNHTSCGLYGISSISTFYNYAGGQIRIDSVTNYAIYSSSSFTNGGGITIGANAASGQNGIHTIGVFNNNAGGQISIDRVTNIGFYTNSVNTVTNRGTITIGAVSAGNTFNTGMSLNSNFNNDGGQINIDRVNQAIYINASTLTNSGTITVGASSKAAALLNCTTNGYFSNNLGGVVKGSGSITASGYMCNGGTLAPGTPIGIITFDANESLNPDTLAIDINSSGVAGIHYDQLVVNGTATMGGTLALSVNYTPAPGDQITIISANAVSGTFATVKGLSTGWDLLYKSNAVVLSYATTNTWTGAISTAWENPGNWTVGVPVGVATVTIPDVTNDPVISTSNAAVASLLIQPGASLTLTNTGALTINGASGQGLYNKGTVQNNGTINIGNTTATGANGLINEATFNNNTGAHIHIDRVSNSGIFNKGGTFINTGAITIGSNATVGLYGIVNAGAFNNNSGAQLVIDQATTAAISNPAGNTFTNAGAITIGGTAATGQYGISNTGTFNNNTGGALVIDRVSVTALLNAASTSVCSNAGTIIIGATAAVGTYGISNNGTFTHTAGQVAIDRATTAALYNNTGSTFTNTANITIGANAASGLYGIQNYASFNNNTGSQLNIDQVTTTAIYHTTGTFTNAATITIGATAASGTEGIGNYSTFNNNTGAQIHINRVTTAITAGAGTCSNAGTITIGSITNVATLLNTTGTGTFSNATGGLLKGAGSIAAARFADNGGTLMPGSAIGTITLNASETLTKGTIAVEVNGSGTAGTNFDQLVVNGTATLGGTLQVTINYTPTSGDQIKILSATTVTGTFATVTGLPDGWQIAYQSNAVVLNYTLHTNWTGAVSTAWNTAGNWTKGVPTADALASIPDVTNDPVISTTNAVVKNITIQSGGLLTIAPAGVLTINGLQDQSLYNQGTVQNNGTINLGNATATGANAIVNEASFNNNTGAHINIDRFSNCGLFNSGGTLTNEGTITIGANAIAGLYGIVNSGTFNNNSGAQLLIDQVTTAAISNPAGNTLSNAGVITIGGTAAAGQYGINNSGTVNNNAGSAIYVDRTTADAISNAYGSAFTNAGTVTIGAKDSIGGSGFSNTGATTNTTTGVIIIDRTAFGGFYNNTGAGKLINTGRLTIGGIASVGIYGIRNYGTLTNTGGQISIDRVTGDALNNYPVSNVTNTGVISIGANAPAGANGIYNQGIFINNAGGQINIDQVTANGIYNATHFSTSFNNQGTIAIGLLSTGNTINYGINIEKVFNNNAGGQITIERVNSAFITNTETFSNAGNITIGATTSVAALLVGTGTGTLSNNTGGLLKSAGSVAAARYVNNGGTLAPGAPVGTFAFDAAEAFTNNTLAIEIKGEGTPGIDFDQVTVNGTATLGGNLTIDTLDGFTLVAGQSFVIVTAASIADTFATVTWPAGVTGTVTYSATTATLHVLSPLPFTLVEFTGQAVNNKVLLKWQSANEKNTASFTIERSADSTSFTTIGTVAAMGSGAHSYSFTDNTPLNGNNYYRLKMIDLNGRFTYSRLVTVKFNTNGDVQIAPVPADNYVMLTINDASLMGQRALVYNTAGVAVANVVLSSSTRIGITGWPSGVYFVRTTKGTYRFIKL